MREVVHPLAPDPSRHQDPWTYVVQAGTDGPFKIGRTSRPVRERVEQYRAGNPEKLRIMTAVRSRWLAEARVHELLQASQLRGEWFANTPQTRALVRWISTIARYQRLLGERWLQQFDISLARRPGLWQAASTPAPATS